jgi:hypothetical protein
VNTEQQNMWNIPTTITQGDRFSWWEHLSLYNPLTNTLSCFIRGQSGALDLTATGSVDRFEFTVDSVQSMGLPAGKYKTQFVIFELTTTRKTLGSTDLLILPSFEGLTQIETRSSDEIELETITSAIARLVSGAVSEYRIGDRMMRYQDLNQLTQRQQYLRNRIAKAKNPGSIGGRNVGIRFENS